MPYADRWGITITKQSEGVYEVSRGGKSMTVTLQQIFQNEAINEGAALFQAIESLARVAEEVLPSQWQVRHDYALSRWKMAAYADLITQVQAQITAAPPAERPALRDERDKLISKRDVWVAEEARLKSLAGADV